MSILKFASTTGIHFMRSLFYLDISFILCIIYFNPSRITVDINAKCALYICIESLHNKRSMPTTMQDIGPIKVNCLPIEAVTKAFSYIYMELYKAGAMVLSYLHINAYMKRYFPKQNKH